MSAAKEILEIEEWHRTQGGDKFIVLFSIFIQKTRINIIGQCAPQNLKFSTGKIS